MNIKEFCENLITGLVNDEPLSKVLLKMQVIVDGLNNSKLRKWLDYELNGYPSKNDIPEYRRVPCDLHVDASGPMGLMIKNHNLPTDIITEEIVRKNLSYMQFTQPIIELEKFSKESNEKKITIAVPGCAFHYIQVCLEAHLNLLDARLVTSPAAIQGVIAKFKSILLQMILDLNKELPEQANLDVLLQPRLSKVADSIIIKAGIMQIGNGSISVDGSTIIGGEGNFSNSLPIAIQEQITDIMQRVSLLETNLQADEEDMATCIFELQNAINSDEKPSKIRSLLRSLVSIPTVAADELIRLAIDNIITTL